MGLGASAVAEFIADLFLCPFEACRIRAVSDPNYAPGMVSVGKRMVSEMGVVNAFYSGLGPILLKQIPYTMAKFAVQQQVAEVIYNGLGTSPEKCSGQKVMAISLSLVLSLALLPQRSPSQLMVCCRKSTRRVQEVKVECLFDWDVLQQKQASRSFALRV